MERFGRGLLLALAASLIGASVYLAWLIREREETLNDASRYNLQWSASQAAIELTRLQLALGLIGMPGTIFGAEEVRLRFDILKNRLTLLNNGEFRVFANRSVETSVIVDEAFFRLALIEPAIDGMQSPHFAERALDQLRPLTSQFIQLAAEANRYGAEQVARDQTEIKLLNLMFKGTMAAIVLIGIGVIGLLFRHNRLLNQARANLERSAAALRHASELAETASKAKSDFLAKMSHEIRTPMNGVLGMADILIKSDLNERQQRLLGTIRKSATTLLAIINDILDFSRIESGKMTLDEQDFDVRQGIEGAVELLADQAFRKGVELTLAIDDRIPERIRTDGGRLQQVCVNVIGNAIKFTQRGDVDVRVTQAAQVPGGLRLNFEVRDTGIGIDDATKDRLFTPFIQADNSISRRFGGTGLGLAISRHIVEMLGGQIDLRSEIGKGTTVSFWIPLVAASGYAAVPRPDLEVLADKRILVVDDRPQNRDIATAYLKTHQAVVEHATSADDALARLDAADRAGAPFHVVVADRIQPGLNGTGLAEAVKSMPQHASVAIILLMALSSSEHERTPQNRSFRRILTKPLRRNDLLNAVAECVETGRHGGALSGSVLRVAATRITVPAAHVLVAEDNPVNVEVMRGHLESLGCTCDVVTNGAGAIDAAARGGYALVLMDCQMPEVDGLTATRRIREREAARNLDPVPIIAVTANAFAEDRNRCAAAGMSDYLSKPFFEEQLAAVLVKWLPKGGTPRVGWRAQPALAG
jgi:signal transduction histidine kinase/CheY-like chemotaxis protein